MADSTSVAFLQEMPRSELTRPHRALFSNPITVADGDAARFSLLTPHLSSVPSSENHGRLQRHSSAFGNQRASGRRGESFDDACGGATCDLAKLRLTAGRWHVPFLSAIHGGSSPLSERMRRYRAVPTPYPRRAPRRASRLERPLHSLRYAPSAERLMCEIERGTWVRGIGMGGTALLRSVPGVATAGFAQRSSGEEGKIGRKDCSHGARPSVLEADRDRTLAMRTWALTFCALRCGWPPLLSWRRGYLRTISDRSGKALDDGEYSSSPRRRGVGRMGVAGTK
ncbi:hypothetical protein FKP32DRAFT_1249590 [Trametes sanguinea]|nr:hypothetical protein FKP32DRAFT_1249590 [Trametes sanguinea]